MKTQKWMTAVASVLLAVWILSAAIATPILFRPFYYLHIDYLQLPELSGKDAAQIEQAYNQVVDYCIGLSGEFSAGDFPFSQQGAQHFRDVRILFQLDLILLVTSFVLLVLLWWAGRKFHLTSYRFGGRGPLFWAAIALLATFAVVSVLAALDFNAAFTVFHTLFFPGKDNWMFSYKTDPIIRVLPQVFFRNCALLILGVLILLCLACIGIDFWQQRKAYKKVEMLPPERNRG